MSDNQSIKESLAVIKKALQDEHSTNINDDKENLDNKVLILNNLVKEDGTTEIIQDNSLKKEEIKELLNNNISKYLDENIDKWLNKNIHDYLNKYIKKNK